MELKKCIRAAWPASEEVICLSDSIIVFGNLDSVTVAPKDTSEAEVWPWYFGRREPEVDDSTGNRRITGVFGGSEG